jgi:hypothetical protein
MYDKSLNGFLRYTFGFVIITLILFFGLRAANVSPNQLIDCITGMLTLWWLLVIVTVPWNVHFEAKSVLNEVAHSRSIGITVDDKQEAYVKKVARYGLLIAICLHLFSAAALFMLSALGISRIGYAASVVALLLTGLRPAVRAYEYIWGQLTSIKHRVRYPREDVVELRNRVKQQETKIESIDHSLDKGRAGSFAYETNNALSDLRHRNERLFTDFARASDENKVHHEILRREGQEAIAKISQDTQFLDHVREIVRLVKSA